MYFFLSIKENYIFSDISFLTVIVKNISKNNYFNENISKE